MKTSSSISNPASFREEAQFQRTCAVCGASGDFEAHHVLSKSRLKREGAVHRLYDPRNALRLCPSCHVAHTDRRFPLDIRHLTPESICFAWDILGVAARNFFDREYGGIDRRYTLHEEGACPLCQA